MVGAVSSFNRFSLGLDFGTESVRVLVVDIRDGRIAGEATEAYRHGVIDRELPGRARCRRITPCSIPPTGWNN